MGSARACGVALFFLSPPSPLPLLPLTVRSSVTTVNGRFDRSTRVTVSEKMRVPNFADCALRNDGLGRGARIGGAALQCVLCRPPKNQAMSSHLHQRVLITAAASGIGLVMADAFMAAGATVYICDRDASALDAALSSRPALAGRVCDVSDEAQVAALFAAATTHLQVLDILVSNAGIAGPTAN